MRSSLDQIVFRDPHHTIAAREVIEALSIAGVKAYAAGGAPRDWLAGCNARDLDICVDHDLDTVHRLLRRAFPGTDPAHRPRERGFLLRWGDQHGALDISILRSYRDIRSHDTWTTCFRPRSDLVEDALLRDFSINAFYYDFAQGVLLDPLSCGLDDLKGRVLRLIGHPSFLASTRTVSLRIVQYLCAGYTPAEKTLAYLEQRADPDVSGMGRRLRSWIAIHVVERGMDLGDFRRQLEPWLHTDESKRLLNEALTEIG